MANRNIKLFPALLLCALLALFTVSAGADGGAGDPCRDFETYLPWTKTNSLPRQGTYVLENDVTLSSAWGLLNGESLDLCLNGHTVRFTSGGSWSANYAIELLAGATLSVYDHTGNGQIVGDGMHPTVGVSNGTFNLYGGTLTGGAGAVFVNRAYNSFGYSSAFNMRGGRITGNRDGRSNSASYGGVYVGNGTFSISGDPTITGNTVSGNECNVYLNGAVIDVDGSLDYAAHIGVTVSSLPADGSTVVITSGLSGSGMERVFTCEHHPNVMCVGLNADGEAALGWAATMRFDAGEGSGGMASEKAVKGGVYTLPFHSFVNPEGKRFVGWQINGEGDPVEAYETIPVTDDTVLTAVWETGSGPISQHIHEWVITVDENDPSTATVVCVAPELASDECNYKEEKWVRLNVNPLSKTYDGRGGFTATVDRQSLNLTTYLSGFPDDYVTVSGVTWYKADGTALTGLGPVNAGSYTAKATVTANNDASRTATIQREVTIERAAAPSVTVTGLKDLPLTDESQPLVTATDVSDYGTIRYRLGGDGAWTDSIPQASASGAYDVYWYFESENYENIASEASPERAAASISARHDHDGLRFTQWMAADSLPTAAGNYFLTGDVALAADWTIQNDVRLCLNGNTVSGGGHQLTVKNGGALTLYAPEDESGGTLTGFAGSGGAILIEQGGSLTTHGVEMTALTGSSFANAQYSASLRFAGAVTVFGTYTMDGGSITASSGVRGGVYVSGGAFRVSRRVVITGNTVSSGGSNAGGNVYLESGSVITLAGALEEGTSIGVRTWYDVNERGGRLPGPGESIPLTSGYGAYMRGVDPADRFTYDYAYTNKRFVIGLEGGEAVVLQHAHDYVFTGDEETDTVTVRCANPYCEFGDGAEYTVSLSAEDAEYTNSPHPATVTSTLPDGMKVTYSVSYAMADGAAYSGDINTGAPYQVGDYVAALSVYEIGGSPAPEGSVSVDYSITEPARPESHVTAAPRTDLVFNGKNQVLVDFTDWTPEDVGGLYFSVDNPKPSRWSYHYKERPYGVPGSWTNPEPKAADIGTHTVYYYIPESSDTHFGFLACGSAESPLSVEVTIRPKYTVTFTTDSGNIRMSPVTLIPEEEGGALTYTLPEPNVTALNFDIRGFAGWQVGNDSANLKPAGAEITVSGDMALRAIWRPWHDISTPQVTGQGTVTVKSRAVEGETVALTITPDEGFELDALVVRSYGRVITVTDGTFVMPYDDVNSITATFRPVDVSVTFAPGDDAATGTMETVTVYPDGDYILPECGFTAPEGQEFLGWDVNGEILQPGDAVTLEGDTQMVALWQPAAEEPVEEPAEEPTEGPAEEPTEAPAEEPAVAAESAAEAEPVEEPTEETAEAPAEETAEEPAVAAEPTAEPETMEEPAEEPDEKPAEEPAVAAEPAAEPEAVKEPAEEPAEKPAVMRTITFDGGGAEGSMDPEQAAEGSEYIAPACAYSLEGITFDAWQVESASGAVLTVRAGDTVVVDGDMTFMATWLFDEGAPSDADLGLEYVEEEQANAELPNGGVEIEYDEGPAIEDDQPSEVGSMFNGAGIAGVIAAAVLVIAGAGVAVARKKKK